MTGSLIIAQIILIAFVVWPSYSNGLTLEDLPVTCNRCGKRAVECLSLDFSDLLRISHPSKVSTLGAIIYVPLSADHLSPFAIEVDRLGIQSVFLTKVGSLKQQIAKERAGFKKKHRKQIQIGIVQGVKCKAALYRIQILHPIRGISLLFEYCLLDK